MTRPNEREGGVNIWSKKGRVTRDVARRQPCLELLLVDLCRLCVVVLIVLFCPQRAELVAVNQVLQKKLDNHLEDHERGEKGESRAHS